MFFSKNIQTGFLMARKKKFGYLKAKSINRKLFLNNGAKLENIKKNFKDLLMPKLKDLVGGQFI